MVKLEIGKKAPEFSIKDQDGNLIRLSDYKGKNVVLYFYPKDDTPGCTKEACNFRDSFSVFKRKGIEVIGVSKDNEKSHKKFIEKYNLPFRLLADEKGELCERYCVWVEKSLYGRKYMGIARTTFLIDKKGNIKHIFENVNPEQHDKEILNMFKD